MKPKASRSKGFNNLCDVVTMQRSHSRFVWVTWFCTNEHRNGHVWFWRYDLKFKPTAPFSLEVREYIALEFKSNCEHRLDLVQIRCQTVILKTRWEKLDFIIRIWMDHETMITYHLHVVSVVSRSLENVPLSFELERTVVRLSIRSTSCSQFWTISPQTKPPIRAYTPGGPDFPWELFLDY